MIRRGRVRVRGAGTLEIRVRVPSTAVDSATSGEGKSGGGVIDPRHLLVIGPGVEPVPDVPDLTIQITTDIDVDHVEINTETLTHYVGGLGEIADEVRLTASDAAEIGIEVIAAEPTASA